MRLFKFFISHSVFIALCAVALCLQTSIILHLPAHRHTLMFVFFATLSSYNFYWFLSKFTFSIKESLQDFLKKNGSLLSVFLVASSAMLYYLMVQPGLRWPALVAMMLTLIYSLPLWPTSISRIARNFGFLKTITLAFTWAYVTVFIPASLHPATGNTPFFVLFTARFLFMLLLCTIFDMRDSSVDLNRGFRSLATDIKRSTLIQILTATFGLYIICGLLVREHFQDYPQMVAFFISGILVWVVFRMSLKPRGYYFYYFLVDGLMLVTALATFIASVW